MTFSLRSLLLAVAVATTLAPSARAAEPKLTVAPAKLAAALHCTAGVKSAKRTPIMLVTGTGASGTEAYAIGKPALDASGRGICYVDFPNHTTADLQVSVQYLVYGLKVMSRRAGRKVAVLGISQGALLPRIALTYWPSLRPKVDDVIGAAGPQHGTTVQKIAGCSAAIGGCVPAAFQQSAGSKLLTALNAQPDETPGPTSWTTTRSSTDETVQPTTGKHPTSSLKGATNVLIQSVCPGRQVSHIGTILDSVTFALAEDAINHKGAARVSRLPKGVCTHRFAPGLDDAQTSALVDGAGGLTAGRYDVEPKVTKEPAVRAWFKRRS